MDKPTPYDPRDALAALRAVLNEIADIDVTTPAEVLAAQTRTAGQIASGIVLDGLRALDWPVHDASYVVLLIDTLIQAAAELAQTHGVEPQTFRDLVEAHAAIIEREQAGAAVGAGTN